MPRTALDRKAFAFHELKMDEAAAGTFSGYLAVFSNVDLGDDVIEKGAFSKTLLEAKARKASDASPFLWPILWQHNQQEPIGGFTDAYEDDYGLFVKGQLDLNVDLGRRAHSGMKMGYMRGLSIGYDTIKHKWVGDIRHLMELRLVEGSAVTFPMNPEALVGMVKSATHQHVIDVASDFLAGKLYAELSEFERARLAQRVYDVLYASR